MACKLIQLEENSSAFICGHQDHECNDKGPLIYGFSDGFEGTLEEICKRENINPNFCEKDKLEILYEKGFNITMMSCSCSICGDLAINNALRNGI